MWPDLYSISTRRGNYCLSWCEAVETYGDGEGQGLLERNRTFADKDELLDFLRSVLPTFEAVDAES